MDQALQSCPTKRPKHVLIQSPEMIEVARTNYRVLPTFEANLSEQSLKEHYSMVTNDYLRCHWRRCLDKFHRTGGKRSEPFQIPCPSDFHFYNGEVMYRLAESWFRKNSFKYNFKPGPGFDHNGEMPIPNEMKYKRTQPTVVKKDLKSPKQDASDATLKNLENDVNHVRVPRVIPARKVEKKTNIVNRSQIVNKCIASFGRPISGKRTSKVEHKANKHTSTKTTIQVTEKATVKVNKTEHKIMFQNTCTVAVHNRKKSTLI